ncbi:MAG: hypothetical protein K8T20_04610 [Planctomycetes bacterium]|nr:hypothetical protein [Planctomycetota bacterium]
MGFATVYCDKCGSQILGSELEKGNAATRGDKYFCPECAPSLPPEAPGAHPDRKGSTKFRKPSESGRNTDIIRNLQAMGGSRGGTTRVTSAPPPAPGGLTSGAKAGIAIGGVVVLAVIVFAVSQMGGSGGGSGGGSRGGTGSDPERAKASYEQAESLRGKGSARAWLDAAQKAKRDSEGTEYSDKSVALVRDAQAALEQEEKTEKIAGELRRVSAEARAADDPMNYETSFRDLLSRARRDAPTLVDQIQAALNDVTDMALHKMLDKVDMSLSSTPAGYRRVKEGLAEVASRAASAGPAGKVVAEQVAKKIKEADDKFGASVEAAYAEFEKRILQMLQDLKVDEADRAIDMFVKDYAGTAVEAKAKALKEKVAAKKKDFDNSWMDVVEADWKKDLGDMKLTFDGKEMRFAVDGPEGPAVETETDRSRHISFAKADANWKDYNVDFEVYLEEHGGSIMIRCDGPNPHVLNFIPPNAKGEGLPKGQWIKLGLTIVGAKLKISVGGNIGPEYDSPSVNGTFQFVGYKGSKFRVRNVRVRRLR